jgi:4-amino-4-deoxy-L-arabinose transferase-like glycosyltransferase
LSSVFKQIPPWGWAVLTGLVLVIIYSVSLTWCGPWDPWETHYGEVARNIVLRHDPLDLWWKPGYGPDGNDENVFYSKHALPFWCVAVSFWVFGIGTSKNPAEMVTGPLPEISLRLPSLIAGLLTILFLAYVVRRLVNWRAGVLTALVLGTMPQFAMVTRQALTDMFFVGPVCLAMGAWALAWLQPDRELRTRGGRLKVPFDRLYLGFLLFFVLAALVPLLVLHHHVVAEYTINRVMRFRKRPHIPNLETLDQIKLHLLIYWALAIIVLGFSLRWRKASQVWMAFVYIAGGLAMMGKGLIGPGLIGLLILCHILVTGRARLLLKCGLPLGILIFVITCFPWHHAMWLYRGERWANELIVINNLARFTAGEQKQAVGTFAFYFRTLGLAAFPWAAVVPIALWDAWNRYRRRTRIDEDAEYAGESGSAIALHRFALLWFVVSFALVSYSVTKYYHYLLPALPPLAILVGVWLDGLGKREGGATWVKGSRAPALACVVAGLCILALVVREAINEPAWIAHLTTYLYTSMWREGAPVPTRLMIIAAPFAVGLILWAARRMKFAIGAMAFSALLTTTYVIDDYLPAASESWSQRTAFRHYYEHRGPDDKLLSWWFYYRGETYFSKSRIWVLVKPDRAKLKEFIEEHRGKGINFWIITTAGHAKRMKAQVPVSLRDGVTIEYENFHYAIIKVPVP